MNEANTGNRLVLLLFLSLMLLPVAVPFAVLGSLGTIGTVVVPPMPTVVVGGGPVTGSLTPVPAVSLPGDAGLAERILAAARTWINTPYAWGGCTRTGVDCSCFVEKVLAQFGIDVPRTTVQQVAFDRPIPRDQMQPGDTIFYDNTCTGCGPNPTHEGFYLAGNLMLDAGSNGVQIEPILWNHFRSVGRPPGL